MKTNKNMNNQEIAALLRAISAAYEIKGGNKFKIIAYDRAATAIEHATSEIKDLWDDGKLDTVPGVGVSIGQHLDELFRTGKVKHFKKIMSGLPMAMFEFLDIPGIGPKTAFKLCESLGINGRIGAVKKLKRAAEKRKVRLIEGFGERSEKDILTGIAELGRREERMLLPHAAELAKKIITYIKKHPEVKEVHSLGSLRRCCSTVGDIDIAVKTDNPGVVIDHFVKYSEVKKIINKGKRKASVMLKNRHQVDFRVQRKSFGAMLQYFTGSKAHNIHLREEALKKGLSLSEYGIKVKGKLKRFENEKDFYSFLGMDWIPPEIRENTGEIEAAQAHKLPSLVKFSDIKGDFHTHSDFRYQESSHDEGINSFEEIVQKAISLGYEYIGLADHSPSVSNHTPRQIITLLSKRKQKIEQIKRSKKLIHLFGREKIREIKILNTLEVDILSDGSLAVPDKGLELLDFVFIAVHSSMRQSRKKMTKRILNGLAHPKVMFLAHPTGRKLGKREGYELEWEKIFDFCLRNNKWLEINAMPDRLDLTDVLVREAVKNGVKLVIDSDAHEVKSMSFIKYGVSVARRGWAEKKDVINALPWNQLRNIIK
ncbi:DNA polymerase/3'-5' exonuclease PolX [Candidatus Microgenomates bacterium]|nr:DNA polymerase/3'-5' exonuclease PolX [Candidatus Microgenomates bacterium]